MKSSFVNSSDIYRNCQALYKKIKEKEQLKNAQIANQLRCNNTSITIITKESDDSDPKQSQNNNNNYHNNNNIEKDHFLSNYDLKPKDLLANNNEKPKKLEWIVSEPSEAVSTLKTFNEYKYLFKNKKNSNNINNNNNNSKSKNQIPIQSLKKIQKVVDVDIVKINGEERKKVKGKKKKSQKLFCLCQKPYDPKKFYLQCNNCKDWFCGPCTGISEEKSKILPSYICPNCNSEVNKTYCICRRNENECQNDYYIGCDNASCEINGWVHGACVGIFGSEAKCIKKYLCPKCEPNSLINKANFKYLNEEDQKLLSQLFKEIQLNKCSKPLFHIKYNPGEKQKPMHLQEVQIKVRKKKYEQLREFIGDLIKITDFWKHTNSKLNKSAQELENLLKPKINNLRQKITLCK